MTRNHSVGVRFSLVAPPPQPSPTGSSSRLSAPDLTITILPSSLNEDGDSTAPRAAWVIVVTLHKITRPTGSGFRQLRHTAGLPFVAEIL
jgi:hypothetical protein